MDEDMDDDEELTDDDDMDDVDVMIDEKLNRFFRESGVWFIE